MQVHKIVQCGKKVHESQIRNKKNSIEPVKKN